MKQYFITNSLDANTNTLYITSISMTSESITKVSNAVLRYKKKIAPEYQWDSHVSHTTTQLHAKEGGTINIITDAYKLKN